MTQDSNTPALPLGIASEPLPWRSLRWPAVALLGVLVFQLLYPGSTPFILDEPQFILFANEMNTLGRLATRGLPGTMGREHGPGAVWIYQGLLLLTHDPVQLMAMRVAFVSSLLSVSLLWLSRTTRLWPWAIPALVGSPYLWYYSRLLWDNSFVISFATLALASYAAFLRTRNGWLLTLAALAATYATLVHLMCIPLAPALLAHALLRHRVLIRLRMSHFLLGLMFSGAMAAPYIVRFVSTRTYPVPRNAGIESWFFFLLGPRLFSGYGLDQVFLSPNEHLQAQVSGWSGAVYLRSAGTWSIIFQIVSLMTVLVYPIFWVTLLALLQRLRRGSLTLAQDMGLLAIFIVTGQCLLNGLTRTYGQPAYFSGSFPAYAILLWLGFDYLACQRWGRPVIAFHTLSLVLTSMLVLYRVHTTAGTRGAGFGTTLGNQVAIVRELQKYSSDSPVDVQVPINPLSFAAIEAISASQRSKDGPNVPLIIRYSPGDPLSGRVELVRVPQNSP